MGLHKLINGVRVEMDAEEEAEVLKTWASADERKAQDLKVNGYKWKRMREYPSVPDQLDMLWNAIDKGSLSKDSDFYMKLKDIKDKYPKPTGD